MTYYVSHIKKYQLERGEPYVDLYVYVRQFSSWRKANRFYQKKRREFEKQWSWVNDPKNKPSVYSYGEYQAGGIDKDGDGPFAEKISYSPVNYGPDEIIQMTAYYPG